MTKGKRANPVTRYLRETRSELRKVAWPSRQEATNLTVIVIAVTVAMAISLGFIDYIFSKLFGLLIR
ncbi:MAG: preprotein translocase subunit SecE [Anaerolineae bacterium]